MATLITATIPELPRNADNLSAALAYAEGGLYVLPVAYGEKNPGSVVGSRWPALSSRDPEVIHTWFQANPERGIAIHAGKSGLLIIDVDQPELVPDWIWAELEGAPFQTSRAGDERRGHYFLGMGSEPFSNSTGDLSGMGFDVRGANGVVITAPSTHAKAEFGGQYEWKRTGSVPQVPESISSKLRLASESAQSVDMSDLAEILAAYDNAERPELLRAPMRKLTAAMGNTGDRHQQLVALLPWAVKEAMAGYYSLAEVYAQASEVFVDAVTADGSRGSSLAQNEFDRVMAWAVAQAQLVDPAETRERVETNAPRTVALEGWDADGFEDFSHPRLRDKSWGKGMLDTTESGVAELISEMFEGDVLCVEGLGSFSWVDGRWVHDIEDRRLYKRVSDVCKELDRYRQMLRRHHGQEFAEWEAACKVAKMMKQPEPEKPRTVADPDELKGIILRLASKSGMDAVVSLVKKSPEVGRMADELDSRRDLLGVANGVVDLRTGELLANQREWMITTYSPIRYKPKAQAPRWELFMSEVMCGDQEMVNYLHTLSGLSATGEVKDELFLIHSGSGANGKSTYLGTLAHVLGPDLSRATGFDTFTKIGAQRSIRSDVARLRGSRFVPVSEGTMDRVDESALKSLVGDGEPITARSVYAKDIEFQPRHTIHFQTNTAFSVVEQTDGIWRRVKFIEWKASFVGRQDNRLKATLRDESEGILAWLVQGAIRYYSEGVSEPQSVTAAVAALKQENDALLGFLPGEYVRDDNATPVKLKEVHSDYKLWMDGDRATWGLKFFKQQLIERGFEVKPDRKNMPHVHGIRKRRNNEDVDARGYAVKGSEPQTNDGGWAEVFNTNPF